MSYESLLAEQVPELLEQADVVVLDTRDPHSFAQGHLPNAKPADEANIARLIRGRNKAQPVLVYCYHGNSSRDLCRLLGGFGYTQVYNLEGGWQAWASYRDRQEANLSASTAAWLSQFGFEANNLHSRVGNGMSALMVAAHEARADIVEELLQAGADPNHRNDDGNAALWFACVSNAPTIIQRLAAQGANLNNQNVNGASCLIYAASAGRLEAVKTLVSAGADLSLQTLDGFNALDSAATLAILKYLKPCYATLTTAGAAL
ncbi:MAG: ankyrin repeat domain-containing protein [Candidatus Thiothrix sulfatifontis]|nr:MAG: ankyrin repeat domain-containing protein [Candidatus Thiothrix sulfatifontis]